MKLKFFLKDKPFHEIELDNENKYFVKVRQTLISLKEKEKSEGLTYFQYRGEDKKIEDIKSQPVWENFLKKCQENNLTEVRLELISGKC